MGAGEGLAFNYVPGRVAAAQPGLDVGYIATGQVGAGAAGISLTGHGGTGDTYTSVTASATRHGGGIDGMGVRITSDGTVSSEEPGIVAGEAYFIGVGAIRYTEPPNSPPPPNVDSLDCGPGCATAEPVVVTAKDPNAYGSAMSYGYIGTGVAGGIYRYPGASNIPGSTMQPTGMQLSLGGINGMQLGGWGSNVPAAAEDEVYWSMTFKAFR